MAGGKPPQWPHATNAPIPPGDLSSAGRLICCILALRRTPPTKHPLPKHSKPAKKSGNRVALFAKSVTFCPRAQPRTKKSRPSPDAEKSAGQRKTASDYTEPNSQTPLHQLPALIYS